MSRTSQEAYDALIRRVKAVSLLGSCGAVLHWDHQTYMPSKGGAHRAEQLALLAGLCHEQFTAPEIGDLLSLAETGERPWEAGSAAAVNLREIRRAYDRATRIPAALVQELARTATLAQDVWVEARKASDFGRFRPWLEKLVGLKREEAQAVGRGGGLYDALLDEYEPGETAARLTLVFAELRTALVDLVGRIAGSGRRPDGTILRRLYPIAAQEAFGKSVVAAFGFDFQAGRLDVTTHPFCSGIGPGDTRLTTRYDLHDFGDAFFSILHEAGHGLYDQGLDAGHYGTPMGEAVSLGIHESQSRLWENFVGRSRAFWEYWLPRARQAFPEALAGVDLDGLVFAVNEVRSSFIRVDADEATYNLHIVLRFELEQALIVGDLAAADLPGRLERTHGAVSGMRAARRRAGVSPGYPLERGQLWLFSNLHARKPLRRAVLCKGAGRAGGPRRAISPGGIPAAQGVAARENPPARPTVPRRRVGGRSDGGAVEPGVSAPASAGEAWGAVRGVAGC